LRSNTSKREKHSKSLKRMSNNPILNSKEKRLSKLKNTRTWRDNKKISSIALKLKIKSFKSKTSNLIKLSHKASLESESKLSTGRVNIMTWRNNMLSFKVSSTKRRPSGKVNSISSRDKKIKLRKITTRLF
jgi:hypothetical protein